MHLLILFFLHPRPSADAAPGCVSPSCPAGERTHRVCALQRWGGPLHCRRLWLAAVRDGLELQEGAVLPHGQEASRVH